MADWNHTICDPCWLALETHRIKLARELQGRLWGEELAADEEQPREPYRVRDAPLEPCCACGTATRAGIYLRAEPGSFSHCDHRAA